MMMVMMMIMMDMTRLLSDEGVINVADRKLRKAQVTHV